MVLVIDTSSSRSGVAVLSPAGQVVAESVNPSGRGFDLAATVAGLVEPAAVTRVAVAVGPGSFTGIRVGASYAAGLAMGLRVPLHRLGTLELARARGRVPAVGVSEAGRGRIHFQVEGEPIRTGEPGDLPEFPPASGWVREEILEAARKAGRSFLSEAETISFGEAAKLVLGRSEEVAYGRLSLEYMESFGGLA